VNRDPRIDAYIAKAQPFARHILEKARERVHAALPGAITAAFKAHAALNFWRGQELETSHSAVGAMGQFGRIRSIEELPADDELDRLIREAADLSKNSPAPRKAKHPPKPAPEMHPEFAAALDQAPEAKAALESFPPSAQRDYFEWIGEAKQDATRQKRIATAVEWLSEGKRRHWKHQKS